VLRAKGFDAATLEGAKSQYDVLRGGELLFSKEREGRFPDDDEILAALAG
jgi:hypothetical protein